jgi:xanthine dehydrogenase accessory factor
VSDLVVVRGGGDLGSGVAVRLWRCGFRLTVLETARPIAVRRQVAFAEAVYEGRTCVEEVPGYLCGVDDVLRHGVSDSSIPVVVDPEATAIATLQPRALIDAIMAKRNLGTTPEMAPRVVALGPGFTAGIDAHAVVETHRGPHMGRVLWQGSAAPNTGLPGEILGQGRLRVLRAPSAGTVRALRSIGDLVNEGDVVAEVDGSSVAAPFSGVLRGLVRDGLEVPAGTKIGDVDPRRDPTLAYLISDKALAVAGGALEAILDRKR